MRIEQQGPLSWLLESETEEGVIHMVTLYSDSHGKPKVSCTCRDFECRHLPKLNRGADYRACCCKHIRLVIEHIKWEAVEAMIRLFSEGEND